MVAKIMRFIADLYSNEKSNGSGSTNLEEICIKGKVRVSITRRDLNLKFFKGKNRDSMGDVFFSQRKKKEKAFGRAPRWAPN